MKILIVGHPDDEFLWFNPDSFDRIILVFRDRYDDIEFNHRRLQALSNHPYRHKMIFLNYEESGITNRKITLAAEDKMKRLMGNWHRLELDLPPLILNASEIYTHNQWGEFGHPEHVMINAVVNFISAGKPVFCPQDLVGTRDNPNGKFVEGKIDIFDFLRLREFYQKYNIWTFRNDYLPPPVIKYYREDPEEFKSRKTQIII